MKSRKQTENTTDPIIGPLLLSAAKQVAAWRGLQKNLSECFIANIDSGAIAPDPFKVTATLSENAPLLESLPTEIHNYLAEASKWAEFNRRSAASEIEKRLTEFCSARKIGFVGRFPSYVIEGFLTFEISPTKGESKVGTVRIRSLLFDAIAPTLAQAVAAEKGRLFDPAKFLAEMHGAFQREVLLHGAGLNDMVPIRALLAELIVVKQPATFFKNAAPEAVIPYSAEFFARDLAKLLKSGLTKTAEGMQLQLGPTSIPSDGIAVRLEDTRIIGRIGFNKESI